MPFLQNLLKLIFPPKCIFCGRILSTEADIDICGCCSRIIPFFKDSPVKTSCKPLQGGCDYVICTCHYSGIVKDSLIRFKFFNKPGYYRTFAKLMSEKIKKMTNFRNFDIIVSVPLYKDKESIRGYNQSLLISKQLSKEIGVPEDSSLLVRVRNTGSQSLLPKSSRHLNVKNAFRVNNAHEVKGKKVLLVDDILTTGSTLNECSRVLKEAGARMVVGAVIATGRRY